MAFDPRQVLIFLVEVTAVMRKIEIKTLKGLGFEGGLEAADGDRAIEILQGAQTVDLIISDWNMPNKDGYELLCWVKGNEATQPIPFLMATGQGDKAQEKKAVNAGVNTFVAKPFNEAELKAKIEEALGLVQREASSPVSAVGPRELVDGRVKLKVAHIQITDHVILRGLKHLIGKGDHSAWSCKSNPPFFSSGNRFHALSATILRKEPDGEASLPKTGLPVLAAGFSVW